MKGIVKQFVFICSSGLKYVFMIGSCQACGQQKMVITANSEEEAIKKFEQCGGRLTEDGRIVMPKVFCDLAGL